LRLGNETTGLSCERETGSLRRGNLASVETVRVTLAETG
jgi:hypothetical protein